jgi:putative PIN family toxin of toxin-antitoxin system
MTVAVNAPENDAAVLRGEMEEMGAAPLFSATTRSEEETGSKKMGSDPNSFAETGAPRPALAPASVARKAPIVLDTNIILDVFVFDDIAAKSVKRALEAGEIDWIATQPMRDELERVLAYPQIMPRLAFYELSAGDVLAAFDRHARLTDTAAKARLTCSDADDQKFIDLAVAAQALLLSKDKHILSMAKRLRAQGVQARKAM